MRDDAHGQLVEAEVDVVTSLVAGDETPKAAEPGMRPFHLPAVPTEAVAAFDTTSRDARRDAAAAAVAVAATMVIGLVGVQLVRAAPRAPGLAAHRRYGVEHRTEFDRVVAVGRGEGQAERRAVAVDHEVALGARLAPVDRARPGATAPLFARTAQLSTAARDQSISSAPRIRARISPCTRAQTPAACQSLNRRQQVMPDPHPISRGSISHGSPAFSTNRMPVSAGRFSIGGRPPLGPGRGGGGSKGSMIAQRSSGSSACAIPQKH
jgi:hypothetical protein